MTFSAVRAESSVWMGYSLHWHLIYSLEIHVQVGTSSSQLAESKFESRSLAVTVAPLALTASQSESAVQISSVIQYGPYEVEAIHVKGPGQLTRALIIKTKLLAAPLPLQE